MPAISRTRPTQGRYRQVSLAPVPGDHLPREGQVNPHVEIRHGVVDDPNGTLRGRRQRVAINLRTDALEQEYAYERISEAAYRAGRLYQAVLERSGFQPSLNGWRAEPKVDSSPQHDAALVRALESAADAVRLLDETRPIIGMLGERVLVLVLGERMTLTEVAARMAGGDPKTGRASKHAASMYAWTFRQALEALADHWARGKRGKASG